MDAQGSSGLVDNENYICPDCGVGIPIIRIPSTNKWHCVDCGWADEDPHMSTAKRLQQFSTKKKSTEQESVIQQLRSFHAWLIEQASHSKSVEIGKVADILYHIIWGKTFEEAKEVAVAWKYVKTGYDPRSE